jgi:mxaJ protein
MTWIVSAAAAAATALALLVSEPPSHPAAEPPSRRAAEPRTLRVCADPNNLPFSNEGREGFDNAIAGLIARELGATLEYTWWAQRRGFIRNTLGAGACDLVFGVPSRSERALATRPYYRSTYVFVSRPDLEPALRSLDDPRLRSLRIGVHLIGDDYTNTPPAHALARRGIIENVVGYTVYGDYSEPNPPARLIQAVARGEVDVAIAWGPLAGYFAPRQSPRLVVTAVSPTSDGPDIPFVFDVAMAVRRGDDSLRVEVDAAVARRRGAVDSILRRYGVPLAAAEPRRAIP